MPICCVQFLNLSKVTRSVAFVIMVARFCDSFFGTFCMVIFIYWLIARVVFATLLCSWQHDWASTVNINFTLFCHCYFSCFCDTRLISLEQELTLLQTVCHDSLQSVLARFNLYSGWLLFCFFFKAELVPSCLNFPGCEIKIFSLSLLNIWCTYQQRNLPFTMSYFSVTLSCKLHFC